MIRLFIVIISFSLGYGGQALFTYTQPARSTNTYTNITPDKPTVRTISYNFLQDSEIQGLICSLYPNVRLYINSLKRTFTISGDKNDLEKILSIN